MSSFLLAAVELEREWIVQQAAGKNSVYYRRDVSYHVSAHMRLLDMCAQAIPHICVPSEILTPTLWHPDISLANLYVSETGLANLTGVIDWQHAIIAPYCMQARYPTMMGYEGERITVPSGMVAPKLPENFPSLSPMEQEACRVDLKLAFRHKFYESLILQHNPRRLLANIMPFGSSLDMFAWHVLRLWSDGVAPLRNVLIDLQVNWNDVSADGVTCPIEFSEKEIEEHNVEYSRHTKYIQSTDALNKFLECEGDGKVTKNQYSKAMQKLVLAKNEWDEQQNGGPFPYSDGRFSFFFN